MTAQLADTMTARRALTGAARLGDATSTAFAVRRAPGAPYDLLAAALGCNPRGSRIWRGGGGLASPHTGGLPTPGLVLADPGRRRARPGWAYPARRPALPRLRTIRAVLAAPAVGSRPPAGLAPGPRLVHSGEPHTRARPAPGPSARHLPAAEIHWPQPPRQPLRRQVFRPSRSS